MSDIEIGSEWIDDRDGDILKILVVDGIVLRAESKDEGLCTVLANDLLRNYRPKTKQDSEVADMVNHPPHYKDASGIECIEVTKHMQFCGGNCFKYLYRAGKKGDLLEDLKKAMWYADYARVHEGRIGLFQRLKISKNIKTISKHRYYRISSVMDLILSRDWLWVATEIEHLILDIEFRELSKGEKVTLENAGSNL